MRFLPLPAFPYPVRPYSDNSFTPEEVRSIAESIDNLYEPGTSAEMSAAEGSDS
jgi:hypothetical protein